VWSRNNGGQFPKRILYFRNGVSREMIKKVLEEEVAQIKKTLITESSAANPKNARSAASVTFTVIIATKRHHTRIFTSLNGDANSNSLPGTLADTWTTGAISLNWHMVSHKALKGTAKTNALQRGIG
jgi:eukaryotic translation initiation factor 2C